MLILSENVINTQTNPSTCKVGDFYTCSVYGRVFNAIQGERPARENIKLNATEATVDIFRHIALASAPRVYHSLSAFIQKKARVCARWTDRSYLSLQWCLKLKSYPRGFRTRVIREQIGIDSFQSAFLNFFHIKILHALHKRCPFRKNHPNTHLTHFTNIYIVVRRMIRY